MQFSCADFTFPLLNRKEALQLIRMLELGYVDIGLFERSSHFSPSLLAAAPRPYTLQAVEALESAELYASDVFLQSGLDPADGAANDPNPKQRERSRDSFAQAVEFCIALGCKHLTGLPGTFHAGIDRAQDVELAAEEALRRFVACREAGLQYSIEPHIGSICTDVASTKQFLERVPGLTLTLDYGHFIASGETSEQVHTLLDHASHIHVRGGAPGRLQTSVKENEIDFAGMIARLERARYPGFLALEYVWLDWNRCNRTDNVSETILLRQELAAACNGGTAQGQEQPQCLPGER